MLAVCRHWVSKNIPLLLDKNPNVRQMAGKALATIYSMDPHTVRAAADQMQHHLHGIACTHGQPWPHPLLAIAQ